MILDCPWLDPLSCAGMAFQPEHALAAPGEVVGRRTPHPAEAGDDHVVHQTALLLRQSIVEVGGEVGYVHLGLLELASVVPVHGLPAGELVEYPDARETAPVSALAVAPKGQVGLRAAGGVVDGEHSRAVALPEA